MASLAVDDAAWSNAWRGRSAEEKTLLSVGLLILAATAGHPAVAVAVLIIACAAALGLARIPARTYLRALAAPLLFVAIGVVSVAITVGGAAGPHLWSLGPVAVTAQTLARAGEVAARSLGAVAALVLLATTTPVVDLLALLRRCRVPETVVDITGLVYRMLFTLLDAVATVRSAQTARLGYAGGAAARRSLALLGSAVLARAWHQARRLESGLAGRGYTTSLRTLPRRRHVSRGFVAASLVLLTVLAAGSLALGAVVTGRVA